MSCRAERSEVEASGCESDVSPTRGQIPPLRPAARTSGRNDNGKRTVYARLLLLHNMDVTKIEVGAGTVTRSHQLPIRIDLNAVRRIRFFRGDPPGHTSIGLSDQCGLAGDGHRRHRQVAELIRRRRQIQLGGVHRPIPFQSPARICAHPTHNGGQGAFGDPPALI